MGSSFRMSDGKLIATYFNPMKKITLILSLCLLCGVASAQNYRTAAGLRIGRGGFGISAQQKIMERSTLEGILSVDSDEFTGTLLLEKHHPLLGKGFNYYLGGGGHIGTLNDYGTFYGADAIVGVEMKLPLFPVLLSLDMKPAVHVNHEDWFNFGGGFTIRYILVKEKKDRKKILGIFGGGDNDKNSRKNKNNKKNSGKEQRKTGIFNW